jgi:O-antigen/teichoic acid export membrane protein
VSDLRTLYRESSHYLSGQIAAMALAFVSFPVFTRVLSVADYGMMSLAFQIAATAVVLSKMGLQNSIQRFYQEYATSSKADALGKFCSTILFGAALCAMAVAILFIIGLELVPDSLISPVLKKVLLIGSGLIFVRGIQPIVMNFLRAQRRTRAFNGFDVLAKGTSIALVCLLLFAWSRSVKAVLIGTVAVELASVVVLTAMVFPRGTISLSAFDQKLFRSALAFGLPLAGCELAAVILDSGDRVLVQHYLGFQALGYYSCAYNITNYIAMFLMYPVNLAVVPIYMKMWDTRGPEETGAFLSKALDNYIMAALCVLAGVAVTARSAVIVLGSQKLQEASTLLPVLMLGVMLYTLHIFFNAGLIIHKKTTTMVKIVASSAGLNIVLNILLIPRIGLQGAAIATLISYAVFLALIAGASLAVMPLRVNIPACLRYLFAATSSVLLVSPVQCSPHFLNLIIRGAMCVSIYVAVLYGIDRFFRIRVNSALRYADGLLRKPGQVSRLTTASTVEARSKI